MNKVEHWLLLRGLARESSHWGEFVPLLQAGFPEAKITLLDLPGTGIYYRQTSPASIPAIAEQVRNCALERGLLDRPVMLLTVSLGAMVAWQWLQRYPEEVCGAVLINTSFANLSPVYQRIRWQSFGRFLTLLTPGNVRNRERAIVGLVSNRQDRYDDITEQWTAIQNLRPMGVNNCLRQLIAAATYCPVGNKPKQPVLLLSGQGDRLVAPQCSEAIQNKWQLPLSCHPWAGHDLTLDDGHWVVEQLNAWLEVSRALKA